MKASTQSCLSQVVFVGQESETFAGRLISLSCQRSQPRSGPVYSACSVALTHISWQQAQQQRHRSAHMSLLLIYLPLLPLLLPAISTLIVCLCSCGWIASPRHGSTAASSQDEASERAIWRTPSCTVSSTCCRKMLPCASPWRT